MIVYIIILLTVILALTHNLLKEDFSEYKICYYRMITSTNIYKTDTSWYFVEADVMYHIKTNGFYLNNEKVLLGWFITWMHPYSAYWLLKYRSYIRKLKKSEKNKEVAENIQ